MADSHNLTRDEAEQRARLLRVASYHVSLDLADSQTAPTFSLGDRSSVHLH